MNQSSHPSPANPLARLNRPLWAAWVVLMLGVGGAWGWLWYRQQAANRVELPVYGQLGDFALVERSGQAFGKREVEGHVWILNFFFSRCTEICPATMPQMARLQDRLAAFQNLRLVSITVDPDHDNPRVLAEYAQRFDAQSGRWYFLTGDANLIYALSINTFHMAAEALPEGQHRDSGDAFLHDGHFVLVDSQAQIRGYYDGLDDEAMERLLRDTQALLRQASAPISRQ
jgi:protein SCO1/2